MKNFSLGELWTGGRRAALATALVVCPAEGAGAATPEAAFPAGVTAVACPPQSIRLAPGARLQDAVDAAGPNARFCLLAGVHRLQSVRPLDGQQFSGEAGAVLNGGLRLGPFHEKNGVWSAEVNLPPAHPHGDCRKSAPLCNLPEMVFVDDRPLEAATARGNLAPGRVFLDRLAGEVDLAEDPAGHVVEISLARFAFKSAARDVVIRNLTIEKFASPAQAGAIDAQDATGWRIEDCELRLNSAAGAALGPGGAVRRCDVHHNGQIGVKGRGDGIVVEVNRIHDNNIWGFDPSWEAGGVKLFLSRGALLRGNDVRANLGGGLWCDTDCQDVTYVDNTVADNLGIGISHEISNAALIQGNRLSHNGAKDAGWFWGAAIGLEGSQNVRVLDNKLDVAADACGIVLIDQGRPREGGGVYKTRLNLVSGNVTRFAGRPCAGGISDVARGSENFGIIENGQNVFDNNIYYAPAGAAPGKFAWGHDVSGWDNWRALGPEPHGREVIGSSAGQP